MIVPGNSYSDLVRSIQDRKPDDPQFVRRLNELVSINELLTTLNTAKTLHETLDIMLLTIMGHYVSGRGGIYIKAADHWRTGAAKGVKADAVDLTSIPQDSPDLPTLIHLDQEAETYPELVKAFGRVFKVLFTIKNEEALVGFIGLGKSMSPDQGVAKEPMLTTIAGLSGVLVGNGLYRDHILDANKLLQRQLFQLNTLYEITGAFARCLEDEAVFQVLANNLMGQFFISRCAVMMFDEPQQTCRISFQKNVRPKNDSLTGELHALSSWEEKVLDCDDVNCHLIRDFMKGHKLRYALPIVSEGTYEGLLLLGPRLDRKELESADKDFILSIARQAAAAIENVRLQKEAAEKQRLEKELQLAREIQQKLLPKKAPELEGYDLAVEMRPYYQVGGDFYDFITHKDGRLTFCLADVSGKSLPASMIMSTAQASLRALNAFGIHPLKEVIEKLNLHLYHSTQSNKFVTMFYGVLDPKTHKMSYINAGHNPPILIKPNGELEELRLGGMVVGLFPLAAYQVGEVDFEPGSELVIFTDGLSEVTCPTNEDEEYGDQRMLDKLRELYGKETAEFVKNTLIEDAMDFSENKTIDDLTLLFIRRRNQS